MDYEKKYNEALERAKAEAIDGYLDAVALETIFPELKESEDERIIMELKDFVRLNCGPGLDEYKRVEEWCYWLEKQKEQKPISFNESYNPDDYEVVMKGNATSLKRKEKNPVEWSRQSIIGALTKWLTEKIAPLHKKSLDGTITEREEMFEAALLEMRSLVNSPDFQIGEDAPAEWSEEERKHLYNAIEAVKYVYDVSEGTGGFKCVEFLKSLRPQPHWKPSEEQMDALISKLPIINGTGDKVDTILESLYNDLKKL